MTGKFAREKDFSEVALGWLLDGMVAFLLSFRPCNFSRPLSHLIVAFLLSRLPYFMDFCSVIHFFLCFVT